MAEIKIYGVLTSATAEGSIIYGSQAIGSFFSVDSRENVKESIKQLGMIIFDRADQKYYKWTGTVWEETLKEVSIPDSINTVIKPILTLDPVGPGENEPAFKYIYVQDGNYYVWNGSNWVKLAKYSDITTAITEIESKIIKGIKVNNVEVTPVEGIVNIEIPAQVQPDWNATEGPAVILNKPEVYTKTEVNSALSGKQDTLTEQQIVDFTNKIDVIKLNGATQQILEGKIVDLDVLTKEDIFKVVTQTTEITEKTVVYCIESAEDNSYTYYLYTGAEYIKLNPDKTFNAESNDTVTAKAIADYITTKLNDINTALNTKLEKVKVNTVEATIEEKAAILKTDETSILYTLEKGFHLPQAWIDYLTRETFAIPALTLSGDSTRSVEYGTSVKIAANTLKHRETNISNINANTLKLYKGNTSVVDLDPATSDTTIDYTFDEVITSTVTLQLKCTDTLGTTRQSGTISFSSYKPVWYGALDKSVITGGDVASLTKINGASFGKVTFVSTEGQYGYFVTAGTISAVTNTEGFAAPIIQQEGKINVDLNGKTVEYNVYRIEAALAAGSNTLVVS